MDKMIASPGEQLLWRREHRSRPAWYTHVRFVRLAGTTRAVVLDPGDNERRVNLDSLYRKGYGEPSIADEAKSPKAHPLAECSMRKTCPIHGHPAYQT